MNFGDSAYQLLGGQFGKLFLLGLVIFAVIMLFQRQFSKMIGFAIAALILSVFVFDPTTITDLGVRAVNAIFG